MSNPVLLVGSGTDLSDLRTLKRRFSRRYLGPVESTEAVRTAKVTRFSASAIMAPPASIGDGNIVGVGVGEKLADDGPTGIHALTFLVKVKYPKSELTEKTLIPPMVDGLPTDVVEVGVLRPFAKKRTATARAATAVAPLTPPNPKVRTRPAAPGCSIGFREPADSFTMAGTFGALVKDSDGVYILSNNHVLADENSLPAGSPIFQSGLLDGGSTARDQVASLTRFIRLDPSGSNEVDCAIAKVARADLVTNSILQIGAPTGTADAVFDMMVHKFGRTTSYTAGRITSIDTDVTIQYESGPMFFPGQITIAAIPGTTSTAPFSMAGDSGSLIVERATGRAVGLLFAGSPQRTIANHIGAVLTAAGRATGLAGRPAPFDASLGPHAEMASPKEDPMDNDLKRLREVKSRHSRDLLSRPGVSGVGVELDDQGRPGLVVHLDSDQPDAREGLPDKLEGHTIRYLVTGPFRAQ